MKTLLYYFTGTGNSLAVAKGLCSRLGDCELEPIASAVRTPGPIVPAADRIGIVSPLYFYGLPSIVADFSRRLDLAKVRYAFAVITMGGAGGSAALRQIDGILNDGPGRRGIDAGFSVRMPGNYLMMYGALKEGRRERTLKGADRRVEEIARMVNGGVRKKPSWSPFASLIQGLMYPRFIAGVHDADRKFTVDDRCTACGTCAAVCPVENIHLVEGRPTWLHRCEQCMACIQLCPTRAIQAGPKTEGRERYRHPGIEIGMLKEQGGRGKG
ncbi:MAG: EFR1 family ferrodoxin [Methanolinea sp.]|jgi:ferredoxin|nr:EFR1 family ferrodoxin [Methanolinea sp.]